MKREIAMFMISTSGTMRTLWPAPVEMDVIDEGKAKRHNALQVPASRLTTCFDIVRLMVNQLAGCSVDIIMANCTDNGVNITRGDSDEKLQFVLSALLSMRKTMRTNRKVDTECALREIDKVASNSLEYKKRNIHWFIDVETFLKINSSLIERKFPPNLVNLYVIGELRKLHNSYKNSKKLSSLLEKNDVSVRFLLCRADVDELVEEIISNKRYELSEKKVKCIIGKDKFKLKFFEKHQFGKPGSRIRSISFLGFLSEMELCRIGFHGHKVPLQSQMAVSTESKIGKEILFSFSQFMLNESKRILTALFQFTNESKKRGYCIMVAHRDGSEGTKISLILIKKAFNAVLKKSMRLVDEIDEPFQPLPEKSYLQMAPEEYRQIKRRLASIETLGTVEQKRFAFDKLADEYNFLNARDIFIKFTTTWQKEQGLLAEDNKL